MLHHVHGVIRFDAVLERRGEYVHDNIVTQNRRRVKDVWGTSVTAIVIQLTIEILVGGDLILLGLALCQVALPLSGLRPVYRMHTPSSERSFIMRPAVPVHVKEDVEIPSLLAEFRMGPTFWSRVSSLEVSYWQVRRGNRLIIEACWMGMTLLSLSAIVVQLTIELLMGIDLFLLGLILCLVALPLEAACWWRWRLSRMDADTALTLARALSSFRDYVSGS